MIANRLYTNTVLGLRQTDCVCSSVHAIIVPSRGKKQNFGAITRDPFKNFQKKLAEKNAQRHGKVPLASDERAQRSLLHPLNIQSLGAILSQHVPLERHARAPLYRRAGLTQRWQGFKEWLQTLYGGALIRRKLKKVDPFRPIQFARWAQEQFIEVNEAIQRNDKATLRNLSTEIASEGLRREFRNKTFSWQFLEELERPRVVTARVAPYLSKENLYAQVTVRLHSKQLMVVYDLAGRLLRGHPSQAKAVIDYVVFERHLTPDYNSRMSSSWRVCGKVAPQLPWSATEKKNNTQEALSSA